MAKFSDGFHEAPNFQFECSFLSFEIGDLNVGVFKDVTENLIGIDVPTRVVVEENTGLEGLQGVMFGHR